MCPWCGATDVCTRFSLMECHTFLVLYVYQWQTAAELVINRWSWFANVSVMRCYECQYVFFVFLCSRGSLPGRMLRFGPVIREKCTCGMPDNLGPIFLPVATSSMNSDQVGFLLSSRMYQRCGATNVRVRSSHFCAMGCRVPCGCQFFQHVVRV